MKPFTFDASSSRVVFEPGGITKVAEELDRLGVKRASLVSTPGRASLIATVSTSLGSRVAGVFSEAVVHVPEATALAARGLATETHADALVPIGGGSAIGVAKAVALTSGIPILAVPTTYGGSEMTPIWGMTRGGKKTTGSDSRVQPRVVIYDPELTLALDSRTTAASGLNAMAHCIESLYAADANPLTTSAAVDGLKLLARALPRLKKNPRDLALRADALQGSWLAGFALGTVGMSLHHKLSHTLGGSFNLPHAETHSVLLPYTAAYNRRSAPVAMRIAAEALDSDDAPAALFALARQIDTPKNLADIGFRESDIELAATLATESPYPNPRPVTKQGIAALLTAAFKGDSLYVDEPPQ